MEPQSGISIATGKVGIGPVTRAAEFSGLASDSRKVRPGWLFAALPGSHTDGSAYIADAVRRGATTILGVPQAREAARSLGVRFIADDNPRLRLARLAAEFFAAQPDVVAAVTGTNGKTSVSVFLRQIWQSLGHEAASMGTIGVVARSGETRLEHTTPDPVALHEILATLKEQGIEHLALEASSHGLDQFRLDGVDVSAAAFTNITRDHLDYHPSFDQYLAAKLRLFSDILKPGGVAVINADAAHAEEFASAARRPRAILLTVGEAGDTMRLVSRTPRADGQILTVRFEGRIFEIPLPLAGSFQASNALVAAGLAVGLGDRADKVFASLAALRGAPGRLQRVAYTSQGAPIYVDYAHTPDALETVLLAMRPHVRGRLHLVFGCGGDRDPGKRPLMGEIAARLADSVIVTDDNPRSEQPSEIRRQILSTCPGAQEIGDRAAAIRRGIAALGEGDVLIVAGKGHETGQIVGTVVRPFSDTEEAISAAVALGGRAAELPA